ncbi:hypothetical protein GCM10027516_04950 [Niabella aquatica]
MSAIHQNVEEAKNLVREDAESLKKLQESVRQKTDNQTVDSLISGTFAEIISSLRRDLEKNQKTIAAVAFFLDKRSNFTKSNYRKHVQPHVEGLDSFYLKNGTRDRIYELLSEAVKVNAFQKYGMGAFFQPGVYKILPSGFNLVSSAFMPAIDSMAALSNRYTDIKRTAHLVIVGYADGVPVNPSTKLYTELKEYLALPEPDNAALNLALSDLRAQELLRNLKIVIRNNANKFASPERLNIGYISYGRGQALPFKNITDYTENDERRRVVVFYWTVLPDIDAL